METVYGLDEVGVPQPFDIFRIETNGNVLWLQTAESVETARTRIQQLARRSPGDYIVFNRKTGGKLVIKADSSGSLKESREFTEPLPKSGQG